MTTQNTQALIVRDNEGNFYVISQDVLRAGRLSDDKKQALQQALGGEVSGYGAFFSPDINNAFTAIGQNNTNVGANTFVGGFALLNNQNLTQLGLNSANVSTNQHA
jgi:uncharacterized protein YbjQ (UPF0145 family)